MKKSQIGGEVRFLKTTFFRYFAIFRKRVFNIRKVRNVENFLSKKLGNMRIYLKRGFFSPSFQHPCNSGEKLRFNFKNFLFPFFEA